MSDFQIPVGQELKLLLNQAIELHLKLDNFNLDQLSYLALSSDHIDSESLNKIRK